MKKFLKSLLAASLGLVAVFGLISCDKPTPTPTAPTFDCENGVHDAAQAWSSDATKHWHACSLCDRLVDKQAHQWTDWTVTKEATLTEKGSHWRECTVCAYKETAEIPMVAPESIKTTTEMKVYVQVPADWEKVNCYYWQDDSQGVPGDGGVMEDLHKTSWPGMEMTLVDAETHTYGFVIPANTNMIIFNNGSVQTVDIQLKSTNLYVLTPTGSNGGKFDVETFAVRTAPANEPELNKYPSTKVEYEYTTVYGQFPAEWAAQLIYFWESNEAPSAWPGNQMEVVDAEKHIYKYQIPTVVTTIIFNEGADTDAKDCDQTINIELQEGANAYIIVPGEGNDNVSPAKYEDGVLTPLTPAVVPVPELYIRGSFDAGWAALDAYKLVVDGDVAKVTVRLEKGTKFKVASADWGYEFNGSTASYLGGLFAGQGDIEVLVSGTYQFVVSGLEDKTTAKCSIEAVSLDVPASSAQWAAAEGVYGEVITTAGTEIDIKTKWRGYIVVDAQGRIAYMCEMPINGYGNAASDSYARHSAYADYKTNPAFKDLGAEPYDQWGNVEFKLVVPEGGFALIDTHNSNEVTTKLYEFISGVAYAEHSVNKQSINVDSIRLVNNNGVITATKYAAQEVKQLSIEAINALEADQVVVVGGTVAVQNGNTVLTDGTNSVVLYSGHFCAGDKVVVVGKYVKQYKNLDKFQLVIVTEDNSEAVDYDLEKVTAVDQLVDGAKVIIASGDFYMGPQSGTIRTKMDNVNDPCVQVVTLVKSGNNWLLQVGADAYIYYDSTAGGNKISTGNVTDASAQWSISIAEGVMTIENVGAAGRKLQYNASSPRFVAYTSAQTAPELYLIKEAAAEGALYTPNADEEGEIARGTVWNEIFVLGANESNTKAWKVSSNKKTVYDLNGEIIEVTHRLQAQGKNDMTIDLSSKEGYVEITFYALTSSNDDLERILGLIK